MMSILTPKSNSQSTLVRSDAAFRALDDRLLADVGIGTEEYEARLRKIQTPRARSLGELLSELFALPGGFGGLPGAR
jgi:hypothetical protein